MSGRAQSRRGEILYDDEYGHVCACTRRVVGRVTRHYAYQPTVEVDRSVEPTESGSYWYVCLRCGAAGWSGV